MTASNYLRYLLIGLVLVGLSPRVFAVPDDEVIVPGASSSASSTSTNTTARLANADTSAKSSHHRKKKKKSTADATASTKKSAATETAATAPLVIPAPASVDTTEAKPTPISSTPITISPPSANGGPVVETGLPVARHTTGALYGYTTIPNMTALPHAGGTTSYQVASAFPVSTSIPVTGSGSYMPTHTSSAMDNFNFTNFDRKTRTYPWKLDIITTEFWIGEGGSNISSTDNIASAWDTNWRANNRGTDTPDDRDGYLPGGHIAMTNPFYVALPFNDLAFPDKARHWLPSGWYRPPKNGRQVSACKDRWVEIKNAQGETCYAQWEDVGPLRYDHAEYVFGPERPDTYTRAGLDVSPAVAKYLNIDGRNRYTRWRFVDDADVMPGAWLQYDEQALLFNAIKSTPAPRPEPIQSARAPLDDQSDIDANQKKVDKAKG